MMEGMETSTARLGVSLGSFSLTMSAFGRLGAFGSPLLPPSCPCWSDEAKLTELIEESTPAVFSARIVLDQRAKRRSGSSSRRKFLSTHSERPARKELFSSRERIVGEL